MKLFEEIFKESYIDYDKYQTAIYESLIELDTETVINAFLNFHGNQLFSKEFYDFLIEEGLLYSSEEE